MDTVAAIAGGLLGARWGASAVPADWRQIVHGYPDRRAEDLVELAQLAVAGGRPGPIADPYYARPEAPSSPLRINSALPLPSSQAKTSKTRRGLT